MTRELYVETSSKHAEEAKFFLIESFHSFHEALGYEFASILFSEIMESINPSEDDKKKIANINFQEEFTNLTQAEIPEVLTGETLNSISTAWEQAQILSKTRNHNFGMNHQINLLELLGHLNNFVFFIETLVNRHLLYLVQSNSIDEFRYSEISKEKVMEQLVFIFKEDLSKNNDYLKEIENLCNLYNKAGYYSSEVANAFKPKVSEIIQIWMHSKKLIERFETVENFNEESFSNQLNNQIISFMNKWT